jgi:hypothetical protein
MSLSGTYKHFSCDNPKGEMKALFNNKISDQDLAVLLSADNKMTLTCSEHDKGFSCKLEYSKKPEFNNSVDEVYGKENDLPAPLKDGKSITSKNGNVFIRKVMFPDVVYTEESTVSGFGITAKISSTRDGYIATSVWERVDASFLGFWVMESHDNCDKFFAADGKIDLATAEAMLSYASVRITEKNGSYEMVDNLGNGYVNRLCFKMGIETEADTGFGMSTNLASSNCPSELMLTVKDQSNGNVSVWKGTATSSHLTWSVIKSTNGVKCSITYKKCGDIEGTWQIIAHSNYDNLLRGLAMEESMVQNLLAEKASFTFKHVGKGVYLETSTSKVFPMEPIHKKPGVEHSITSMGMTMTEVFNFTTDGIIGSVKMGENTMNYKLVIGKEFSCGEQEVLGKPSTKATLIMARS